MNSDKKFIKRGSFLLQIGDFLGLLAQKFGTSVSIEQCCYLQNDNSNLKITFEKIFVNGYL